MSTEQSATDRQPLNLAEVRAELHRTDGRQHPFRTRKFAEQLLAEMERLTAERDESDVLRGRMADLLTGTANALKGTPDALTWHDWSDLPAVAQHLKNAVTVRNVAVRDAGRLREAAEAERDEARTEVQRLRELRDAAKIFRRAIESSLGFAVTTGAIDALVDAVDALTDEEPTNHEH